MAGHAQRSVKGADYLARLAHTGFLPPQERQNGLDSTSVKLTMNVYTDPTLLDVGGALEARPSVSLEDCLAGLREVGTDRCGGGSADRRAYQATVTSTGSPTRM